MENPNEAPNKALWRMDMAHQAKREKVERFEIEKKTSFLLDTGEWKTMGLQKKNGTLWG